VQGNDANLSPPYIPGPQTVYLRLCYEECETDLVPIAGSPCAAQDQTRAASRITESFRAAFSRDAPPQALEDDIRILGELFHRIEAVDGPVPGPPDGGLIEMVRELGGLFSPGIGSPPIGSPPIGSPPVTGPILLDRLTACDTIREALAVWVTEVRPAIGGGRCMPTADSNDCLLLAALHFVADGAGVISGPIEIDESKRPIVAPTRLIQELLPCGCCGSPMIGSPPVPAPRAALPERTFATLFLNRPNEIWARIRFPAALDVPDAAVKILVDGVVAPLSATVARVSGIPAADNLFGLTLADTLTPAKMITVQFDASRITESGSTLKLSQVLSDPQNGFDYIDSDASILSAFLPIGLFNSGGDLAGTYPNPTVAGLQTRPVSTAAPVSGDILAFNGTEWAPARTYIRSPIPNPPYGIVAAGAFDSTVVPNSNPPVLQTLMTINPPGANNVTPTFNHLRATRLGNGDILLAFPGYEFAVVAANKVVYIVKGTVQGIKGGSTLTPGTLHFVTAQNDGLVIRLIGRDTNQSIPVPFMVEISAYGQLPGGLA
jgi:hypothetical protein